MLKMESNTFQLKSARMCLVSVTHRITMYFKGARLPSFSPCCALLRARCALGVECFLGFTTENAEEAHGERRGNGNAPPQFRPAIRFRRTRRLCRDGASNRV